VLVVVSPLSGGLEGAKPCRVGYTNRRRCSTALSCSVGGCIEVVGGTAAVGWYTASSQVRSTALVLVGVVRAGGGGGGR
jgi:hypothetical protein